MSDAQTLFRRGHFLCILPAIRPPVSAFTVTTSEKVHSGHGELE